jgi:hypothetical protein
VAETRGLLLGAEAEGEKEGRVEGETVEVA